MTIPSAPLVSDGVAEGGQAWLPGFGLGRVVALTETRAWVDVPRLGHVLEAMRWVLIPAAVAEEIPAAFLSGDWGQA